MPSPKPSDTLVAALRQAGMFTAGERILVAFSGGPDSTALLYALHEEGHEVVAAHYDHALQPGSAAAAAHAARVCASLGVPFVSERRTEDLAKGSLQASARKLRYAFLERTARETGAGKIALGHTADDVVEGAVMHLLRGCGIAGLRGMPASRGPFVRPLLNAWRADVVAFLERRSIAALEDPSNFNPKFKRVAVRRDLLPALEQDRPGIKRRLHAAAARATVLQEEVERAAAAALERGRITAQVMRAMPEAVASATLKQMYRRAGGPDPALDRAQIAAMLHILTDEGRGGRGLDLPGGLRFRVVDARAEIVPRVIPSMEAELQVQPCPGCSQSHAAHLRDGLELRIAYRRPGLRMRPAGGVGTRKLQDIFVDARVPREERDAWPLVFAGERLAWVPGVAIDGDLQAMPGQPALHVTVTRILAAGSTPKSPC